MIIVVLCNLQYTPRRRMLKLSIRIRQQDTQQAIYVTLGHAEHYA